MKTRGHKMAQGSGMHEYLDVLVEYVEYVEYNYHMSL